MMKQEFRGWAVVAKNLVELVEQQNSSLKSESWLNQGQCASVLALAKRLPNNGVILADEVGMGKTRIAVAAIRAVVDAGGRVAVIVPPSLGYQWKIELSRGKIKTASFLRSLWQFFSAWEPEKVTEHKPWFTESVIMVSHNFSNWRLGQDSASWRWALLPEVYAHWRKKTQNRFPRGYIYNKALEYQLVENAALSICDAIPKVIKHPLYQQMESLTYRTPWPGALDAKEYKHDQALRPLLEEVVGLGLGNFDLIIIDEAHRSRNEQSVLSSLLGGVIQESPTARRFAMTATPVELNVSQWQQILERIKLSDKQLEYIKTVVTNYVNEVQQVRATPTIAAARASYIEASTNFQIALSPYVLRRDKREDDGVKQFTEVSKLSYDAYRQEREIRIDVTTLEPAWQQAVCAAEALSVITVGMKASQDKKLKRLRLTMGNGHGIAALIDSFNCVSEQDSEDIEFSENQSVITRKMENTPSERKREQRVQWWSKVMQQPFVDKNGDELLFNHPATLVAVAAIEEVISRGEKVLVFGRFTRPLSCLVKLLNARAMLSTLAAGNNWPQAKIHGDIDGTANKSDWSAVRAAHEQLQSSFCLDELNEILAKQYRELRKNRQNKRSVVLEMLENGFSQRQFEPLVQRLYKEFCEILSCSKDGEDDSHPLSLVSRALTEQLGDLTQPTSEHYAQAFADLIQALCEPNEVDEDDNGNREHLPVESLWPNLLQRLRDEYGRNEGTFARLMHGDTDQHSRRIMQLAFNRRHSSLKVLVTQSMVGREGLNLHEECKTVILLHPEWNPGVVEQQIGRVDRVGSFWQKELLRVINTGGRLTDLPRIEVRPVIFQGTYDEHNWQVLRTRWADLRAQLHGIVFAQGNLDDPEIQEYQDEINEAAPKFSPFE